jgi:hypothetical protein
MTHRYVRVRQLYISPSRGLRVLIQLEPQCIPIWLFYLVQLCRTDRQCICTLISHLASVPTNILKPDMLSGTSTRGEKGIHVHYEFQVLDGRSLGCSIVMAAPARKPVSETLKPLGK